MIASWAVVQWPDTGVVVAAATGAALVVGGDEVVAGEVVAGAVVAGEVVASLLAPAFVGVAWHAARQTASATLAAIVHSRVIFKGLPWLTRK